MDRDNGTIKDLNGICILNVIVSEIYSEYYIVYNSITFVQASPMQVIFDLTGFRRWRWKQQLDRDNDDVNNYCDGRQR